MRYVPPVSVSHTVHFLAVTTRTKVTLLFFTKFVMVMLVVEISYFGWYEVFLVVNIVSVLGREEGFTVKYGLSPRDCPRAILRALAIFYRISRLES